MHSELNEGRKFFDQNVSNCKSLKIKLAVKEKERFPYSI